MNRSCSSVGRKSPFKMRLSGRTYLFQGSGSRSFLPSCHPRNQSLGTCSSAIPLTWYQPNSKEGFGSRFSADRVAVGVEVSVAMAVAVISIVAVGWGVSDGVAETVKVGKGVLEGTGVKVGAVETATAGVADRTGGGAVQVGGTVAGPAFAVAGVPGPFSGEGSNVESAASVGICVPLLLEPKPWQPVINNNQINNHARRLFMIHSPVAFLVEPDLRAPE